MKITRSNKKAGCLFMASSVAFYIAAAMMPQAALYGVGGAMFVIGAALYGKGAKDCSGKPGAPWPD